RCVDGVCSGSERCSTCPTDCGVCSGSDTQPPTAPTSFRATSTTQTTIAVAWNASTDNVGVAGYQTFLDGKQVGTVSPTSATYSGLSCATSYTLGVRAFDKAGNVSPTSTLAASTAACTTSNASIYWGALEDGNDTYDYYYGPSGFWKDAPWGNTGNTM